MGAAVDTVDKKGLVGLPLKREPLPAHVQICVALKREEALNERGLPSAFGFEHGDADHGGGSPGDWIEAEPTYVRGRPTRHAVAQLERQKPRFVVVAVFAVQVFTSELRREDLPKQRTAGPKVKTDQLDARDDQSASVWQTGHKAIAVRGIHVPGMLWDGDQKPGFVWVKASFDEVDGGALNPELSEVLTGVFGTQKQLLAVPYVSNSQNHQGADADPNPCLAFGWGGTVRLEQHLGVGAEVGFSDLGEVNQDRGVFASGVPVWIGNLTKPVHPPVGIVIRKCRNVEGLLWSSRRSGCSTAGRRFNQNYPDKY